MRPIKTLALLLALLPPAVAEQDPAARIAAAADLAAGMAAHAVPAVSVAVIEAGEIAWARAWGSADTETVFQAASISKPVAAMAAMHMSQYGNFGLDEDVNAKLSSWQVPPGEGTSAHPVTLRGLLSHSAGLTVHGFPGYAEGAPLPSLLQILDGEPPANTDPIRVDIQPGSRYRYSGGGYVVLQQLMTDHSGWDFPEMMRRMVLARLGMTRSTYEQPLPEAWVDNAARAHDGNGNPIAGRWHTYPEMAPAGLWTTPSDLARWAIELWNAYHGRSNRILAASTARAMLTRQREDYGLGVAVSPEGASFRFGHGGSNAGYRCDLFLFVETGQGIVIMTNSDHGGRLFRSLQEAAAQEHGWPAG